MSRDWFIDSFGMPFSTEYAAADIYAKLIAEGWFSRPTNVPEPKSDLGWLRDETPASGHDKEQFPEHSQEPNRDLGRGIDR